MDGSASRGMITAFDRAWPGLGMSFLFCSVRGPARELGYSLGGVLDQKG